MSYSYKCLLSLVFGIFLFAGLWKEGSAHNKQVISSVSSRSVNSSPRIDFGGNEYSPWENSGGGGYGTSQGYYPYPVSDNRESFDFLPFLLLLLAPLALGVLLLPLASGLLTTLLPLLTGTGVTTAATAAGRRRRNVVQATQTHPSLVDNLLETWKTFETALLAAEHFAHYLHKTN